MSNASVTSNSYIDDVTATEYNQLRDPAHYKALKDGISQQKAVETNLLNSVQYCDSEGFDAEVSLRLGGLDAAKLKTEVHDNFYNPEVMRAAMCLASTVFLPPNSSNLATNERIRSWFSGLRQIGAESVSGYALSADLESGSAKAEDGSNFFVVKAPRDPEASEELAHEAVIGLFGTNRLRDMGNPHFAYIYGLFRCSTPFIDSRTKKIVAWCNNVDKPVTYCLYENIDALGSMGDLCKSCNGKTFIQYYMQVMLAIRHAFYQFGFTHYDCHADNVLLRKFSNHPFYIKYRTWMQGRDVDVWVQSPGGIATLIDYGMSHIQINHKGKLEHLGHCGDSAPLTQYGVYRDTAHPLMDAYKLLCMSLMTMKNAGNTTCFQEVAPLLQFFNSENTPEEIITHQRKTFYYLPLSDAVGMLSIDDYISFIQQTHDCSSFITTTMPHDHPIMECRSNCLNKVGVLAKAGISLSSIAVPSDITTLYDEVTFLHRRSLDTSYSREDRDNFKRIATEMIRRFNWVDFLSREMAKIQTMMVTIRSDVKLVAVPMNATHLLNDALLAQFKSMVADVAKYVDCWQRLELQISIANYFIQGASDIRLRSLYDNASQLLARRTDYRKTIMNHMRATYVRLFPSEAGRYGMAVNPDDVAIMESIKQRVNLHITAALKAAGEKDMSHYEWYWITFRSLDTLLE
jgi:hypothetical protein